MVFGSPTDIFKEQDTMFCDENTNNYKNNSPNNNIVFLDLTNKDSTLLCRNQPNINKNSLIIDDSNFLTANENTATEEVFESNLNFNEDKPNYIYQILNKTYEGRFQCACYNFESNEEQKKRLLETKKQTLFSKAKIAKIIVGHEFYRTNDFHISSDRLVELANETAKLFPRYLAESFYTKANNNKSAGGLFQLHYAKQREKEPAIGRLQKKATKRKLNDKENIASEDLETIQNSVSIIDEEYIQLWASTAVEERKEIYLWKDIKQIFELFPNFSHPLGYKLIKEDFKNFCNKTVDLFSTNWNTVSKQIIAISKSKCSDKDIKAILKENNSTEEEHQTTLALILLPYLFKRTTKVPSRAKDRVPWTLTKIEVSKTSYFILKKLH